MGANQSCPKNHRLQSTDIKKFDKDGKWICDNCQNMTNDNSKRWRCIKDCDYDICQECMTKWLPGLERETRTMSSVAQDEVPHRHFLATAVFKCADCKDTEDGDRLFCPKCLFDRCYACSFKSLLQSDDDQWKSMAISSEPIDEGESRNIFSADITMKDDTKERYVLKSWKPLFFNKGFDMSDTARIHMQAMILAMKFNENTPRKMKIIFKKPILHKMQRTIERGGRNVFVEGENVILEPFIHGKFIKFNSNTGWINGTGRYSEPQAFTHFTWHTSKEFIVCNLRGVEQISDDGSEGEHDGYYLTDPVICSTKTGKWGSTDLGPEGVIAFFKNHKCTSLCKDFDIPELDAQELDKEKAKTYIRTDGAQQLGMLNDVAGLALFAALAQALKD